MKRFAMILAVTCVPLLCAFAQESAPVITLQQSIDAALTKGDSYRILQGNLSVARAQHAENVSKDSLALSGSLAGDTTTAFIRMTPTLLTSRSSNHGLPASKALLFRLREPRSVSGWQARSRMLP